MALEKYVKSGCSIADIGTGSGILSIAAIKLGASHVVGVDNDLSVINVAKDNAQKNDVLAKSEFFHGSAADVNGQFDIVLANILHNIIVDIMKDLIKLIKPNGIIVLSGIIKAKEQLVLDCALAQNLIHLETLEEDNWLGIIFKRPDTEAYSAI